MRAGLSTPRVRLCSRPAPACDDATGEAFTAGAVPASIVTTDVGWMGAPLKLEANMLTPRSIDSLANAWLLWRSVIKQSDRHCDGALRGSFHCSTRPANAGGTRTLREAARIRPLW